MVPCKCLLGIAVHPTAAIRHKAIPKLGWVLGSTIPCILLNSEKVEFNTQWEWEWEWS